MCTVFSFSFWKTEINNHRYSCTLYLPSVYHSMLIADVIFMSVNIRINNSWMIFLPFYTWIFWLTKLTTYSKYSSHSLYKLHDFDIQGSCFYYSDNIQPCLFTMKKVHKPYFKHSATGSHCYLGGSFNLKKWTEATFPTMGSYQITYNTKIKIHCMNSIYSLILKTAI